MKLYYAPASPFARKVRIAAGLLGLENKLEIVKVDVIFNPGNFGQINPLVKVPALELDNGEILTNSPFICEYLNSISLGKKILPQSDERWSILQDQSIADGCMDAAVLRVMETRRNPQFFDPKWDQRQKTKMENSFDYFTKHFYRLREEWTLREITVFSMIGYVDFRLGKEKWGEKYPRLWNWYAENMKKSEMLRKSEPVQV